MAFEDEPEGRADAPERLVSTGTNIGNEDFDADGQYYTVKSMSKNHAGVLLYTKDKTVSKMFFRLEARVV